MYFGVGMFFVTYVFSSGACAGSSSLGKDSTRGVVHGRPLGLEIHVSTSWSMQGTLEGLEAYAKHVLVLYWCSPYCRRDVPLFETAPPRLRGWRGRPGAEPLPAPAPRGVHRGRAGAGRAPGGPATRREAGEETSLARLGGSAAGVFVASEAPKSAAVC